jgi:hypothetical protein
MKSKDERSSKDFPDVRITTKILGHDPPEMLEYTDEHITLVCDAICSLQLPFAFRSTRENTSIPEDVGKLAAGKTRKPRRAANSCKSDPHCSRLKTRSGAHWRAESADC